MDAGERERLGRVMARVEGQDRGWEDELVRLMEGMVASGPVEQGEASAVRRVLSPFLSAEDTWLAGESAHGGVSLLPSARRDLLVMLERRLTRLCSRVLLLERQALDAAGHAFGTRRELEPGARAWLGRFAQYPVLARLMARTVAGWRTHVRELLTRLARDRVLLADALRGGRPLPSLAAVEGDSGDLHHGGRAVAILCFEDGHRVVYKPKDLHLARAVQELFAWLNEAGLPLPLHVRTVLPRDGYTWEEHVPVAPCREAGEVSRFYTRVGMLVRLMQLLEAGDLSLDNVVARGEHPVLIDTEVILRPRRRAPAGEALAEWMRESVVNLGLLSSPFPIAVGTRAENLGALTPARHILVLAPYVPALAELEGIERPNRGGRLLHQVWRHAPSLNGEPPRVAEHLPHLLEGYREMQAFLLARADALLAPSGPLSRLSGQRVRYLHRPTASYARMLWASLEPGVLASPARYRALLEGALIPGEADADARAIARVELTALTGMDVPFFLCRSDAGDLLSEEGQPVLEGFFEGSALERVRQRVRDLQDFPLALHEDLLRSTFSTSQPPPEPTSPPEMERRAPPAPDWLSEAVALGESLLEDALSTGTGLGWVGLAYEPFHDYERVGPLPPDLLSGSTGVALVLAELYAASGQERFRTGAMRALEDTRRAAERAPRELARAPRPGAPPVPVGAFAGVGAWLYTLSRCAAALGRPELAEEARACATALPLEDLCTWALPEVVAGAGGLLLAMPGGVEPARLQTALGVLSRRLASGVPPPPYPPGSRVPYSLPDTEGGASLCALRLSAGDVPPLTGLTPGALLVRAELARRMGQTSGGPRVDVERLLDEPPSDVAGRLDRIEVALAMARCPGSEDLRERAEELGESLLFERRRTGRWFPERLAADGHVLSAVWGLPALAYTFLRLHAPERFPSLRLLE